MAFVLDTTWTKRYIYIARARFGLVSPSWSICKEKPSENRKRTKVKKLAFVVTFICSIFVRFTFCLVMLKYHLFCGQWCRREWTGFGTERTNCYAVVTTINWFKMVIPYKCDYCFIHFCGVSNDLFVLRLRVNCFKFFNVRRDVVFQSRFWWTFSWLFCVL